MKIGAIISNGIIIVLLFASTSAVAQILPEDPSRGGQLFVSKGCVKCHAIKGEGGKTGPDLGRIDLGGTQLELAAQIWNHTPSMIAGMEQAGIPKPTLTGQEFTEITAYLYFLRFFDEPGNADSGERLFTLKYCNSCHLVSGRDRDGGPGLDEFPRNASPVYLSQSIWNHSLRMMARMVRKGTMWPEFERAEMMDTLAYVKTKAKGAEEPFFFRPGNPRQGRAVFSDKGCTNCHSVYGEGAKEGIDLGKRAKSFYTSLAQIASRMWNKSPEMILFTIAPTQCGVPRFTAKEMTDLLAYLYFLYYTDERGDTSRGKKIFSDIGCAQCHGLDGKRGTLMYIDLSKYRNRPATEIVAGIWNHSIKMREATGEKKVSWPQFKKGEMADLLEYIRVSAHTTRVVFLSSQAYDPQSIGGLKGADSKCQSLAQAAKLEGVFKAWLSDSTQSPSTRFTQSPYPGDWDYKLVADEEVATDWAALTSGSLQTPINIDENGFRIPSDRTIGYPPVPALLVWTNTNTDGTVPHSSAPHLSFFDCKDWTSNYHFKEGVMVGNAYGAGIDWTNLQSLYFCDSGPFRLYCFQQ